MNNSLYMGIDVSKGYADFSILSADRKQVGKTLSFPDYHEGHRELEQYLKEVVQMLNPITIFAGVESTGGYENHWMEVITKFGEYLPIKVSRLNPTGVAKHREADLKHQITDKSSSIAIARYMINHIDRIAFNVKDDYQRYRANLNYISLLDKQKTQLINNLRQRLYQCFPEVLPYCRNGMSNKVLDLLKLYPTSYNMARARQGKNNKIEYLTDTKWLKLREACKNGTMTVADIFSEAMIRDAAQNILNLSLRIKEFKKRLSEELPQDKINLLTSIPGIGKDSASMLLCMIGDISRFKSARQLVGFFGLYPEIKESGDMKKKPHLSRRGNGHMRKTLFMCAMVACNHDPHLRTIYLKSVAGGMAKKAAICKIMTKLLRIIYGVLAHNRKYDYAIDQDNREKFMPKAAPVERPKSMRETEETMTMIYNAPISKKNAHIRKERLGAGILTRGQTTSAAAPSVILLKT